ncbi:portal protein [Gayadomonas joobiniege]|uniref:portal protein n=1 Tax=Gayadomonas joobiniege TaxID=1234606 RepID=UPI0003658221|nr:hypothetical protein [Gayadomonas joobiniege]
MGILLKANAAQLQQQDEARMRNDVEMSRPPTINISSLAAHVQQCWESAKANKIEITTRLIDCLYRKKGEYPPEKLKQIQKAGVTTIYMQVTGNKCRAAKAWLSDLFSPTGDRPFTLEPTPISELPPEIEQALVEQAIAGAQQYGVPMEQVEMLLEQHEERLKQELKEEAEGRAEKASEYIEDMLVEGGWRSEFAAFIDDVTTFPAAILKGPILRFKRQLSWVEGPDGEYIPQISRKIAREFKRVSPFDFYPAPSSSRINDTWCIEHVRFTASELTGLRGVKGYSSKNIANVLIEHRYNGLREWAFGDSERELLEQRRQVYDDHEIIDGLEFCGNVSGRMLLEHGMSPEIVTDPLDEYPVSIVLIGNFVIRAMINPHPTGKSYYYKACWETVPGSFWGKALPEIMADTQDAANAAARALINNMSMGSGPQVAVDSSARPAGEISSKIVPWKVWYFDGNKSKNAGVSFFQPELKANELLQVYERFVRYSDEITGLPSYAFGSDQGAGAAKTASGLSMLMNASSKTIKEVVRNVDIGVIEPLVDFVYVTLMLDPEIPKDAKGDVKCKARGSDSLVHKESQLLRQQELLQMTANPIDMQILGMEGRREQLHEVYKNGSIPADRIVPTREELEQRLQQQMQQGPSEVPNANQ